jgi:hypothetical protein
MVCTIKRFKITIDGEEFMRPGPIVSLYRASPDNDSVTIIGKLSSYIPANIDMDKIAAYSGFRTAHDINLLVATQVLGAGW